MLSRKLRGCWIVQACRGNIDVKRLEHIVNRRYIKYTILLLLLKKGLRMGGGVEDYKTS